MNRQAILHSIVYVALFILFTFLFMLINYPSERLTDQVNAWIGAASEGTVSVGSARIKPPLSLEMSEIILEIGQGRSVDMGGAVVGMRLFAFLSGKRSVDVLLENPWLDSSLTFVSSGEGWDLDVRSMEIDLSQLPDDIMTLPLRLKGKVEVSLNLLSNDPSQDVLSGDVRITSGPIELGGDLLETFGFAPFRISRVLAVATIKDNVVTLGENVLDGDLTAAARGKIRIASANYMASRLDLTLELKPGAEYRKRLLAIFSLMGARPRADGSVNIRVRGTVEKPSIKM